MDVAQILGNVVFGAIVGVVIGVVVVEYTWWRMKRKLMSAIREVIGMVKEDEVLKRKLKEVVEEVTDYAIDHVKERLRGNGPRGRVAAPPRIEDFIEKKNK